MWYRKFKKKTSEPNDLEMKKYQGDENHEMMQFYE